MFYALSEQLEIVKGIKIPHGELRQNLVQYLRSNPKLVSWFMYAQQSMLGDVILRVW